mgnify:CR=1 FL=1
MGYDFSYGYGPALNPADIASQASNLFLVMMGIYFLLMVYSIVAYVMGSLGSYTIAMRRGIKHPWLAFVAICLIGVLFAVFTFMPPQIPLFRDPLSGNFGIGS